MCLKLNVAQHNGNIGYHAFLKELIENNYFRSGAGGVDEEKFKHAAARH